MATESDSISWPSRTTEWGAVPGLKSKVQIKPKDYYQEGLKPKRPFGLQSAPTVNATEEEFADPHRFIQSLESLGREWGIIKVIPPPSWRPKFRLNSSKFLFKTRRQKLSSLGAVNRATRAWLDRICKFHKLENNITLDRQPMVNNSKLDYYRLKCLVQSLGGVEAVTETQLWPTVCKRLGLTDKDHDDKLGMHLWQLYKRIISPYEEYIDQVVKSDLFDELSKHKKKSKVPLTPPPEAKNSEDEQEDEDQPRKRQKRGHRFGRHTTGRQEEEPEQEPEDECAICKRTGTELELLELRCANDYCERDYHAKCLNGLTVCDGDDAPDEWWCPRCLVGTGEFYFDEGEEYTLDEFKDSADDFREEYLQQAGIDEETDPDVESALESKFWAHVEDLDCKLEVEYGADIQSDVKGSGFANLLDNPRDAYAKDMWNLNNFPKHKKSLFNNIKDISGVTTPWGYVGSLFSTFCWHSEDHYTYSVNYQHLGDTKTWYGIPGQYAEGFEEVSRETVPELFEKQPDILFQRATMISPELLKTREIPVYAIDQHAGQFVITFPKAYHCGFNHGFNYNEAVNYAPPEWVPFGEECMVSYRISKRAPLFSHDRLLINVAELDKTEDTAAWLYTHLYKLVQNEVAQTRHVKETFPNLRKELLRSDVQDDRVYQCCECNAISYVSRVVVNDGHSRHNDKVFCLHHFPLPNELNRQNLVTLEQRYTTNELRTLLANVQQRMPVT